MYYLSFFEYKIALWNFRENDDFKKYMKEKFAYKMFVE